MRSMASGAAFHCTFLHATQQAFLEAHERAFAYFMGVFKRLRYDNLTSAVKKVLGGARREETTRFVAFRSHWQFEAEFCTPNEPQEKGGVEGEAGYFRRNHWVPIPQAADIAELNQQLLAACQQDEQRTIAGREQSVGVALLLEREHLLPLAVEGADLAQTSFPSVNSLGCAKVLTNAYSVPLPAGTQVQAKIYASIVEFWHDGRCVARHERCYRRQQQVLDLEHYLDVLYRKPGALAGSRPLEQERRAGLWPASFDQIWEALVQKQGKQSGTRQMMDCCNSARSTAATDYKLPSRRLLPRCFFPYLIGQTVRDSHDQARPTGRTELGLVRLVTTKLLKIFPRLPQLLASQFFLLSLKRRELIPAHWW
jgi:hypothetical protein